MLWGAVLHTKKMVDDGDGVANVSDDDQSVWGRGKWYYDSKLSQTIKVC